MSHSKNAVLKTVVVLSLIGCAVGFASTIVNYQNTSAVLEKFEVKTAPVTNVASAVTDDVRKKIQRLDVDSKVTDLQHKTKPIGQKISATMAPKVTPSMRAVKEGERRMSLPAILLILVFGGVFVFMGMSGPASRLGGRH